MQNGMARGYCYGNSNFNISETFPHISSFITHLARATPLTQRYLSRSPKSMPICYQLAAQTPWSFLTPG